MTPHLLDTNILSELKRPRPSPHVTAFVNASPLADLYISAVTLAEIRFGIKSSSEPSRRAELKQWLASTIRPMFQNRVLAITEDVMLRWRHLVENGRKTGRDRDGTRYGSGHAQYARLCRHRHAALQSMGRTRVNRSMRKAMRVCIPKRRVRARRRAGQALRQ